MVNDDAACRRDTNTPQVLAGSDMGRGLLVVKHWAIAALAASFRESLGNDNFITCDVTHEPTNTRMAVTIQRAGAKTPAETIAELRAEIDRLRAVEPVIIDRVNRRMPCRCHKWYTSRRLTDPGCPWHAYGAEIVDEVRAAFGGSH